MVDSVALFAEGLEGEGPCGSDGGVKFGDEIFNGNADADLVRFGA